MLPEAAASQWSCLWWKAPRATGADARQTHAYETGQEGWHAANAADADTDADASADAADGDEDDDDAEYDNDDNYAGKAKPMVVLMVKAFTVASRYANAMLARKALKLLQSQHASTMARALATTKCLKKACTVPRALSCTLHPNPLNPKPLNPKPKKPLNPKNPKTLNP